MPLTGTEILQRRCAFLREEAVVSNALLKDAAAAIRYQSERAEKFLSNPNTAFISFAGNDPNGWISSDEILIWGRRSADTGDTPCVLVSGSNTEWLLQPMDLSDKAYGGKWIPAENMRDERTDSDCIPHIYTFENMAGHVYGPQKNILDGVNKRHGGVTMHTLLHHSLEAPDLYGWALVANIGIYGPWNSKANYVLMNLNTGEFEVRSFCISSPRWSGTRLLTFDSRLADAFGSGCSFHISPLSDVNLVQPRQNSTMSTLKSNGCELECRPEFSRAIAQRGVTFLIAKTEFGALCLYFGNFDGDENDPEGSPHMQLSKKYTIEQKSIVAAGAVHFSEKVGKVRWSSGVANLGPSDKNKANAYLGQTTAKERRDLERMPGPWGTKQDLNELILGGILRALTLEGGKEGSFELPVSEMMLIELEIVVSQAREQLNKLLEENLKHRRTQLLQEPMGA